MRLLEPLRAFVTMKSCGYSRMERKKSPALLRLMELTPHLPSLKKLVEGLTILLVEDNPGHLWLTQDSLNKAGIDNPIVTFRDAWDCWEFLCKQPYDSSFPYLVLLDLNTPRMDGFELLGKINERFADKCMSVAILTSSTNPDDLKHCVKLGYHLYFVKPLDTDLLLQTMGALGLQCILEKTTVENSCGRS